MTIGVEIASELLAHWAAKSNLRVAKREICSDDQGRAIYHWTLTQERGKPVHVGISEQEIDQNMKRRDQMISLVAHRLNIGITTARNSK